MYSHCISGDVVVASYCRRVHSSIRRYEIELRSLNHGQRSPTVGSMVYTAPLAWYGTEGDVVPLVRLFPCTSADLLVPQTAVCPYHDTSIGNASTNPPARVLRSKSPVHLHQNHACSGSVSFDMCAVYSRTLPVRYSTGSSCLLRCSALYLVSARYEWIRRLAMNVQCQAMQHSNHSTVLLRISIVVLVA
jgi:hypothetical protein